MQSENRLEACRAQDLGWMCDAVAVDFCKLCLTQRLAHEAQGKQLLIEKPGLWNRQHSEGYVRKVFGEPRVVKDSHEPCSKKNEKQLGNTNL